MAEKKSEKAKAQQFPNPAHMLQGKSWVSPDTGIELVLKPLGLTIVTDVDRSVRRELAHKKPARPKIKLDDGFEHFVDTPEYEFALEEWEESVKKRVSELADPFFIEYGVVDIKFDGWEEIAEERKSALAAILPDSKDLQISLKHWFVTRVVILNDLTLSSFWKTMMAVEGLQEIEDSFRGNADSERGGGELK